MVKKESDFKFPLGTKVKLKGTSEQLYKIARTGAIAYIAGHQYDKAGFPQVYVKWDRDHWAYDGEQDMWTFENHFDFVEGPTMTDDEDKDKRRRAEVRQFLELAKKLGIGEEDEPELPKTSVEEPTEENIVPEEHDDPLLSTQDQHDEILTEALNEGAVSEAFIVITAGNPANSDEIVANIFWSALTHKSRLLLEAQLTRMAALAHEDLVMDIIKNHLPDQS